MMALALLSLSIGIIAGLRSMTAPAAVSWAARVHRLNLDGTGLAFLGYTFTPWIVTFFALAELVSDQLPTTPSRTMALPFGTRILTGALSGAAIGAPAGFLLPGLFAGAIGAVIGTLGGRAFRGWLATRFGSDPPAAFIEDAIAIGGALLIVFSLP